MLKLLLTGAVVLGSASFAFAASSNNGIGNNVTTTYTGPNLSGAVNSAINSVYIVQAGFLNASWVAQAGSSAAIAAPSTGSYFTIQQPLLSVENTGTGTVNLSEMFKILNTSNSIGN